MFDKVNIAERPGKGDDRAVPRHGLSLGTKNYSVATLVERSTCHVTLKELERRGALSASAAISAKILDPPGELHCSITWGQGEGVARHPEFTIDTASRVYFCDPSSHWLRGTNENKIGPWRQYSPKRT